MPSTLVGVPISSRILGEGEEVLVDLRPHWLFLSGPAALLAVAVGLAALITVEFPSAPAWVAYVLASVIGVPLLWLIIRAVRRAAISLVVTTDRIILRQGVLRRAMVQIRLTRVAEIHCSQRLWERLLGSGTLVVDLEGEQPVTLGDVRRARLVQRVIFEQVDLIHRVPAMAEMQYPSGMSGDPGQVPRPLAMEPTPPHGTPAIAAGVPADPSRRAGGAASIHEQLVQLDDLRRRGIVSDREFEIKKTELLRRL